MSFRSKPLVPKPKNYKAPSKEEATLIKIKSQAEFLSNRVRNHPLSGQEEEDFLDSLIVAAATDSALIGYSVGGNMGGAIIGDLINEGEEDGKE